MARKKKLKSLEELRAVAVSVQNEIAHREGLQNLPTHAAVLAVTETIHKAVEETGTEEEDVRLAEIKANVPNLPDFSVAIQQITAEWKRDNATYRNPGNPEDFWYSPTGTGNPPKWIKKLVGKKPESTRKADLTDWLNNLEKFRVETDQSDEAA